MSKNKTPMDTKEENCKSWNDFLGWHLEKYAMFKAYGCKRDYLEFPVVWDRTISFDDLLYSLFLTYLKELKEWGGLNQSVYDRSKKNCKSILKAYSFFRSANYEEAYHEIGNIIDCAFVEKYSVEIKKKTKLYRKRAEKGLVDVQDMYHVPFDKTYLCSSSRFSVAGCPALYLGYSEGVCNVEYESLEGTIAEFELKSNIPILDLTMSLKMMEKDSFFALWPILAACYVAVPRELSKSNFKEEYVFPQLLSCFLAFKNFDDIKGIRYYTCRKGDLDPVKDDYKNIILFTKRKFNGVDGFMNEEGLKNPFALGSKFDKELLNKFKIKIK